MSTGKPEKFTGIIPSYSFFGESSNIFSNKDKSKVKVSGFMSTNFTFPPQYKTQFDEAAKLMGVVITFDPLSTPRAKAHKCRAPVPFETDTVYSEPT